jgi:hypothetical protein
MAVQLAVLAQHHMAVVLVGMGCMFAVVVVALEGVAGVEVLRQRRRFAE